MVEPYRVVAVPLPLRSDETTALPMVSENAHMLMVAVMSTMRIPQDIERWPIVQSFALEECGRGGATIAISLLMLWHALHRADAS